MASKAVLRVTRETPIRQCLDRVAEKRGENNLSQSMLESTPKTENPLFDMTLGQIHLWSILSGYLGTSGCCGNVASFYAESSRRDWCDVMNELHSRCPLGIYIYGVVFPYVWQVWQTSDKKNVFIGHWRWLWCPCVMYFGWSWVKVLPVLSTYVP